MNRDVNDHQPIALITGATSGIGAAFAKKLAGKGYNLILHGRREEKLRVLALELEHDSSIWTEVMIAELSNPEELKTIETRIQELSRLDLLINNAGYWIPGEFVNRDPDALETMIHVHTIAPIRLIRAVLPLMLEQKSGGIINVSSVAAYMAAPNTENYCATKAYLLVLSRVLHSTLHRTGVKIQALLPGYTKTEFHTRIGGTRKGMSPDKVVEASLKHLKKGKLVCIPGYRNKLIVRLVNLLPGFAFYRIMRRRSDKHKRKRNKSA